ncbi:MAG: hypothetical protein K1060chlam1_00235 [Candidatus Anoxychlamydiales bacterium]|nr:hypothetical protein [Candidatus Anoxychlamydiales bacterium]
MFDFAIKILDDQETILFSQPFTSRKEMGQLEGELLKDIFNPEPHLKEYYTFGIQVINKIKSVFFKARAIFLDLITLPYKLLRFKQEYKKTLFVYKYLNSQGVSEKYLQKTNALSLFLQLIALPYVDREYRKRLFIYTYLIKQGVSEKYLQKTNDFSLVTMDRSHGVGSKYLLDGELMWSKGTVSETTAKDSNLFESKFCRI